MSPAHILLIEDNEGDIILTLEAFEDSKIKVDISVARDGQEALDFLYKKGDFKDVKKPDLILLDINLPIYNGHEILNNIKTNPELKKIPVIALTTSSSKKDVEQAYSNHVNSFVTKPLEMDDFINAVIEIQQFWLVLSTISK